MVNTAVPFIAALAALMLGWLKWRQAPRGANGLLFQYGVLAAANGWLVTLNTDNAGLIAAGVLPLMLLWTAPFMLRRMVDTQYRIGRPGPVGWMLMLRVLIAWHRRHVVDYVYDPVRRLLMVRRYPEALELATRLQSLSVLKGMEAETAEWVVQALYRAKRWGELLTTPEFETYATVNPALRVYLIRAKMESGDTLGAAEDLRVAAQQGMPGITVAAFWADLLRGLGRHAELKEWLDRTELMSRPQLADNFAVMLEKTKEVARNDTVVLPEPPLDVIDEQLAGEKLERRMRERGPLTLMLVGGIVLCWLLQVWMGVQTDAGLLTAWGAVAPPWVEGGQWWRTVSVTWLHSDWTHVTFNALVALTVTPFAVALFGKRLTLLAWVVTAIGCSVASLLATPLLAVGASGAVLGMVGLVIGCLARRPPEVPATLRNFFLGLLLFLTTGEALYGLLIGQDIGNAGHLGGLLTGVVLGLLMQPVGVRREPITTPWLLAASAAPVVLLFATVFGVISAVQGGYLPDPVAHQQIPYGDAGLAVPAWWIDDQANGWDCQVTGLEFDARLLGPEAAGFTFQQLLQQQFERDGMRPADVGLQRPREQLEPSGVERQVIDLYGGSGRWVIWVTRRGGRTGVLRVVGPAGSYALYAEYLDELAARATPPE